MSDDDSFRISGVLIKAGVPGISGRIYPKELLEQIEKQIYEKPLPITTNPNDFEMKDIVGSIDSAHIKDQDLVCDGQVTKDVADLITKGKLFLTPMGSGSVVDGKVDPVSYSIRASVLSPIDGWENQEPCETEEV